jgi:hypothetical protein
LLVTLVFCKQTLKRLMPHTRQKKEKTAPAKEGREEGQAQEGNGPHPPVFPSLHSPALIGILNSTHTALDAQYVEVAGVDCYVDTTIKLAHDRLLRVVLGDPVHRM